MWCNFHDHFCPQLGQMAGTEMALCSAYGIGRSQLDIVGDQCEFPASFIAICTATAFMFSAYTIFWSIPSKYLSGSAAAGGIALINSIGLLGGFVSPNIMGMA